MFDTDNLPILSPLTKDQKMAARSMTSQEEVRYLVSLYYKMQKNRIMSSNALTAFGKDNKPNSLITHVADQQKALEEQIKVLLTQYANYNNVGRWAQTNKGIGPIIAAGLNGHVDMDKALTPGHILSFGGYNPTVKWNKGERRPWNPEMKQIFFKIGDSFVKQKSRDRAWYGQLYALKKANEINRNENGDFKLIAEEELATKNYAKNTEAYKAYIQGRLPNARLEMRARRFAVIFFISHWHTIASYCKYGNIARRLYQFDILGHAHYVAPDNMDCVAGLEDALREKYNGFIRIEDSVQHYMKQYGVSLNDLKKVKTEDLTEEATEEM